jgi:hypothetical protein
MLTMDEAEAILLFMRTKDAPMPTSVRVRE